MHEFKEYTGGCICIWCKRGVDDAGDECVPETERLGDIADRAAAEYLGGGFAPKVVVVPK